MEEEFGNLCLKSNPCFWIACLHDWGRIILSNHYTTDLLHHKDRSATISSLKMHWCTNVKKHGIPLTYMKDWIDACGCLLSKEGSGYALPPIVSKPQPILIERDQVDKQLATIIIEHNARLVCVRLTRRAKPMSSIVEYKCHRGGKPHCVGTNSKRLRKSKRVECPFRILLEYTSKSDKVSIFVHGILEGHEPSSWAEL